MNLDFPTTVFRKSCETKHVFETKRSRFVNRWMYFIEVLNLTHLIIDNLIQRKRKFDYFFRIV